MCTRIEQNRTQFGAPIDSNKKKNADARQIKAVDEDAIIASAPHTVSVASASASKEGRQWVAAIGEPGTITCQDYRPAGGGGFVN